MTTFAAAISGCGVPFGVSSSCVGVPRRDTVISAVACPMCETTTMPGRESSHTTARSAVKPCSVEQPAEILAAPAGRLVQADRDDHELARERPALAQHARGLGRAGAGALHVGRAAPVDQLTVDVGGIVRNRDDVQVPVEDDSRPGPVAAEAADHDRGLRKDGVEHLDVHADLLQPLRVEAGDLGSVSGGALDLDQLEGQVPQPAGIDLGHAGITGSTTFDGCSASENTVCSATTMWVWRPIGSPVFGFRSSRGKLDEEMSMRIRWPGANRLLVGGSSISTL